MRQFFQDLFSYQLHYNHELYNLFSVNPEAYPNKSVTLYNHMLNAHQIWNNRIQKLYTLFQVWQIHSWSEIPAIIEQNHLQWVHFSLSHIKKSYIFGEQPELTNL